MFIKQKVFCIFQLQTFWLILRVGSAWKCCLVWLKKSFEFFHRYITYKQNSLFSLKIVLEIKTISWFINLAILNPSKCFGICFISWKYFFKLFVLKKKVLDEIVCSIWKNSDNKVFKKGNKIEVFDWSVGLTIKYCRYSQFSCIEIVRHSNYHGC